jgi:hypothetical protein
MAPGWVHTGLDGRVVPLTADQSIPGVAGTIEAQAGQGALRYLNYRARPSAGNTCAPPLTTRRTST